MFEKMRNVFGPAAVTVIIGAIAVVFVFFGVYNPRSTRGMGAGALAATVNGDGISLVEFSREYQQRVGFYENMMKGKVDMNLLKQLGLQRQVLESLISRKLMTQEANRLGMTVSDEEVRQKIAEMPYFKKDDKFDASLYDRVLEANHQTPTSFEEMIRDDLLRNHVAEFLRMRAHTSEKEIENEFKASEDRRQIDYVLLNNDTAKKRLMVTGKEIDDFLKNEKAESEAKSYYEQNKFAYMKPQKKAAEKKPAKKTAKDAKDVAKDTPKVEFRPFDEVKRDVVAEILKGRRSAELAKINQELAQEIMGKAKSASPAQFAALVKSKGLELKTSEKFNRIQNLIPGLGDVVDLMEDAFKDNSPLLQGPKLYHSRSNDIIATNLKSFQPNMGDFTKDHDKLAQQLVQRKEQVIYEQWIGDLRTRAKVSINKSVEKMGAEETAED